MAADALIGCSSDAPEPAPTSGGPAELPPVEAPSDLLGVGVVPAPAALFELASKRYDLPLAGSSWAAFAVGVLGLPITASEAFDLTAPVRLALVDPPGFGGLGAMVALPLRAPDRLIAVASLGAGAPFRAEKDETLRGERLIRASGDGRFEMGVLRNHLVVGGAGSLSHAGAFLSDPKQPLFTTASGRLGGWVAGRVVAELIDAAVMRVDRPQRDLLSESVPFGPIGSAFRAMAEIPFEITLDAAVASLRCSLPKTPALAGLLASLTEGERAALLAADRDASIAIAFNQGSADRVKGAEWTGRTLRALGLVSEPPGAAGEALVALAQARGDGVQLAVERGAAGALAYGACDLHDEEAAKKALAALVDAAASPPKNAITSIHIVETRLTLVGEAVHVFIDREEAEKDPKSDAATKRLASVLLRVESGRLALGTGRDAMMALKKGLRRRSEEGPASLADLAVVKPVAGALPARAAVFGFFDPARWFSSARPSGDPERDRSALLGALEVREERAEVTLALEPAAVRALAQLIQGTL